MVEHAHQQRTGSQPAHPNNATFSLALSRSRKVLEMEGPELLGDEELLALFLGRGGAGLSPHLFARTLLEHAGGLARLSRLPFFGLLTEPGIGPSQAARIAAAFELGRRAARDASRLSPRVPLTEEQVVDWANPRLAPLAHEEVWVLCVDAQSVLKSTWQVGRGGVHGCGLLCRDILTPVLRDAAAGFVLVHNHPSGDPTPSSEDIELTEALRLAARAVCVPLLDHVVIARGGARSFFDLGLLG